jgi:predicted amidophosphoribosyltransferase
VRGAFLIEKSNLIGKEIFVLDDVITSGATINECMSLLKEQGAKRVTALSLALVRNTHDMSVLVT